MAGASGWLRLIVQGKRFDNHPQHAPTVGVKLQQEETSMATPSAVLLEELTKLASDFVNAQKGTWDHKAWMNFLSLLQQKGIATSEEMQAQLGDLLEAMKEYHAALSSTEDIEQAMGSVLNESVAFIKRQQGVWGQAEWEDFLKTAQQNTHTWSAGMEAYVGGVLESLKVFYRSAPAAPAKKTTPASAAAPVKKPAPKRAPRNASPAKTRKKASTKKTG